MRKIFGLSMLIIGTVIGAGFASGREIVSFFGKGISFWVAPLCGICFFVLSVLFLSLGSLLKKSNLSEVNVVLMGKVHIIADIFLLLNSLIVLSGMLAGMDSLFSMFAPIAPFYSILSGIACALIVSRGFKGLLKCNSIIVPVIIVTLLAVCSLNISNTLIPYPFSGFNLISIIIYVSMNMMLASSYFVTVNDLNKKTIIFSCLISSGFITLLMLLIISALNSNFVSDYPMPVLMLAKSLSKPLFYAAVIAIAVSIFTTMMTAMSSLSNWLTGLTGSKRFSIVVVLIAGLIVSNLGFENVVAYLYPFIGMMGIIYIIIALIYLIKNAHLSRTPFVDPSFNKRNNKVHKRSQNTKYNSRGHNKV